MAASNNNIDTKSSNAPFLLHLPMGVDHCQGNLNPLQVSEKIEAYVDFKKITQEIICAVY